MAIVKKKISNVSVQREQVHALIAEAQAAEAALIAAEAALDRLAGGVLTYSDAK